MISHAQTMDIDGHCYVMRNDDKNVIFLHGDKLQSDHIFNKLLKDKNVSYSLDEILCLCISGLNNLDYIIALESAMNLNILRVLFSSTKDISISKLESYLFSIEKYIKKQYYSNYSSIFLNECKVKVLLYTPRSQVEEDSKTSFSSSLYPSSSLLPAFQFFSPSSQSRYQPSDFKNIGKFLSPKIKWNLHTTFLTFEDT